MAASTIAVWDALLAALAGVDGSGSYTHDLSGAGRVARVRVAQPLISGAFVTCVFDDAPSRHDIVLGTYRRDLQFTIVGWGVTGADTDEARQEAACNMMDDVMRAVEADRSLGGLVYDVLCHGRSFIGSDAESGAQYPVAVIKVEVHLRVGTGG